MKKLIQDESNEHICSPRRSLLKTVLGVSAAGTVGAFSIATPKITYAAALTKAEREKMTPDDIIQGLKNGNERFRSGKLQMHDYLAQNQATVAGQYPSAVMLTCIDSRAPAEIIFDTGIGETFNARVAGNIANDDILGSLEFACAVTGAKVVLVMGHTSCGAISGAIANVEMGNLTGLLKKIKPAIKATTYMGERVAKNAAFVDAVAKTNVKETLAYIRKKSKILAGLEAKGDIKMVGAMYSLNGGMVEFLS